jgi:SAM-dependent methyltransferase
LATVPLAERGYEIVAVELGAELAAIARRRLAEYPDVEVVVAAFEDWPLPSDPFDAVVSATAFHWIDPEVRLTKAAQALRPGGSLLIIETRRVPVGDEQLFAAISGCSERFDPTARPPRELTADEPPESLAELVGSSLFDRVKTRRYEWTQEYTTAGYVELLMTFSNVLALEPPRQAGLLDCMADLIDRELGGRISEHIVNHVVVALTTNRT